VRPRLERRTLAAILLAALCGWAFLALAGATARGGARAFDTALLLALRDAADPADPLGPGWLAEFGRDVTALGSVGVLATVTLAVAGYLALIGRRGAMWLALAAVAGAQAANTLLKLGFDRPRPDLVPHGAMTYTSSFPSGHAMLAAATYLTLAAILARVEPRRKLKAYVLAVAVVLTLAVGLSRVYLGVHWPTDVLAGWAAGAGWALACLLIAGALERRGVLRPPPAEAETARS
jgi:undecaprenyl-diphosphatase